MCKRKNSKSRSRLRACRFFQRLLPKPPSLLSLSTRSHFSFSFTNSPLGSLSIQQLDKTLFPNCQSRNNLCSFMLSFIQRSSGLLFNEIYKTADLGFCSTPFVAHPDRSACLLPSPLSLYLLASPHLWLFSKGLVIAQIYSTPASSFKPLTLSLMKSMMCCAPGYKVE